MPIEQRILFVRDRKVMLDLDLADIYGVATKRLNEQVKRNIQRFPPEFMFQLSPKETERLMRSHFATGSKRNVRHRPYVFTEHGALMLAGVLNSPAAIRASIAVVKAFMRLRGILATHKDLARKIQEMERKCDSQFKTVFDALRELMRPEPAPRLPMPPRVKGFVKE